MQSPLLLSGVRFRRELSFALPLAGLALALLATSLFFAFVLPRTPGRMAAPSAALIPALPLWAAVAALPLSIPPGGPALAGWLVAVSASRFAAYLLAVWLCWRRPAGRVSLGLAAGAALLFFLVAACALPNVDRDIYNYIVSGRVAAVHGQNPYYVAPDQLSDDPIYRFASARYTHFAGDNKLPAWMLLNIGLAWLGGHDVIASLLLYRFTFLGFNLASLALVALILRRLRPRKALAGVVLYGWNPIVASYGQSKVDTLMVFFLLLAIFALVLARRRLALVALGLSVLVKLITLPLVAALLLRQIRARRWRDLAESALLLGGTALLLYAPFWEGPGLLQQHVGLLGQGAAAEPPAMRLIARVGFTLAVLWVGLARERGPMTLIRGWAVLALLFSIFLTRLGFSWYLLTLIALVSTAVEWRLALITIALSFASFLLNAWDAVSIGPSRLPDLFSLPRILVYLAFVAAAALGLLAVELVRRGQRRALQSGSQ